MIPLEIHGGQEVYREAGLPQRAVEGRSERGHSVGSLWACSSGGRGWTNLWTRTRKRERFQQNDECSKWMFRNIQHCAKLARVPIVAAGMGGLCPHIHGQGSHKRQAGSEKGQQCERQTQVCRSHDTRTRSGLLSISLFDGTIRAQA